VPRHDRTVEHVGNGSLATRAREAILDSILERRFEDSRLPPENELAEMLGVSRTTVRAALQSLEQHGVLTRSPRRGTQVHRGMNPSMVALQRLIGFARLLEEQGYTVSISTRLGTTKSPPPDVVSVLGEGELYEIERTIVATGEPAIWATDYFPTSLLLTPPNEGHLAASPFEMGELIAGGPIDHALVQLVPCKADRTVVEHLHVKLGAAYLLLKETHVSATGKVLGFSLIHVNDRFVRFQLHRSGEGL
jgi:GntR family transcriptional regulator